MADTPEQQATKDALATIGKWRDGKSYSGVEIIAEGIVKGGGVGGGSLPTAAGAPAIEGVNLIDAATGAAGPAIGSTVGAVAGSRFGLPGRIVGSGVGAGVGSLAGAVAGAPGPTGNPFLDALLAGGGALGGQSVGEIATGVGRVATKPLAAAPEPGASTLRQQFTDVGVEPKVSDFSPNMAAVERSIAQTPTGGAIIREAGNRQARQLGRAKDEFLDRLGPVTAGERVVVGEKASVAIARQVERTGALEDVLWQSVGQQARDVPVTIRGLKAAASDVLLQEQRGLKPNASLVALAEKILTHADEVPWQVADAWRKEFGRNIKSGELISGLPSGENKLLYRSLLTDMEASAETSGVVGLADSYKNLRTFSERRRAIFRDGEVAKILETDPEQVVNLLNAAGGPTAIKRAREAIMGSPELGLTMPSASDLEAWNYVRRHVLEGVFTKAVDENFKGLSHPVVVGSRLDKAIKTIGEDGLRELLTPTEYEAFKNIVAVAKAIRKSESAGALPGTSTTPQGHFFMELIQRPAILAGGVVGGLMGGPWGAGAGAGAGGFVSFTLVPHYAAKILTDPKMAAIVASPAFAGLANVTKGGAAAAREGTQALARLAGILFAQSQREGQ